MKEKQSAQPRAPERQDKLMLLTAALFAVRLFRMGTGGAAVGIHFTADQIARIGKATTDAGEPPFMMLDRETLVQEATNDAVAILAAVEKVGL